MKLLPLSVIAACPSEFWERVDGVCRPAQNSYQLSCSATGLELRLHQEILNTDFEELRVGKCIRAIKLDGQNAVVSMDYSARNQGGDFCFVSTAL